MNLKRVQTQQFCSKISLFSRLISVFFLGEFSHLIYFVICCQIYLPILSGVSWGHLKSISSAQLRQMRFPAQSLRGAPTTSLLRTHTHHNSSEYYSFSHHQQGSIDFNTANTTCQYRPSNTVASCKCILSFIPSSLAGKY